MTEIEQRFEAQRFPNEYRLVDGVAMNARHPDSFRIPPPVLKRHVKAGQYVELRIDSPRFSVHDEDAEACPCPSCNGEMTNPILRHEQPSSLVPMPSGNVPARGWGEDFWVRVTAREGRHLLGVVDNPLVEARLHGLQLGDEICFHEDHLLAVHDLHRQELVGDMDTESLRELAAWIAETWNELDD